MLKHTLLIAKNTFRETMRDRILLSALVIVFLIIGFSLFVASISIDQNTRVIINFSITAIYLLQVFVAIFIGSMLMYKEFERRTFFLILPKPISLESIIIGKALGLTATTAVVTGISTFGLWAILLVEGGQLYILPILYSVIFSILESTLLILVSILFSGITSPILAAIYTLGIYFLGHSTEIIRFILAQNTSLVREYALTFTYYVLPNLEKFNLRNDIIYNNTPTLTISLLTLLYFICYALVIFLITRITLRKKEL
jgi:ABC-type transport system involved in multi-copper enzyme maturation permease subunit